MNKYYIKSNRIFYNHKFVQGYLEISNRKISGFHHKEPTDGEIFDYCEKMVLPGIIDVHNHGFMGWSVAAAKNRNDVDSYSKMLASVGVTGVLATTHDEEALPIVADYINEDKHAGARVIGIHAEGPYRHPKKMGGSKGLVWPEPSLEYTRKLWELSKGTIVYTTLAPDMENIESSIRFFQEKNVVISFGHTDANYNQMKEYIAKFNPAVSTHTGNAMRGIDRRDGGTLGAVLLDKYIKCEVIADFIHISEEVLRLFFKVKDIRNFIIVSDAGELAGAIPGEYVVRGNRQRFVDVDGKIHLLDGTLAGSSKHVLYGVKCLVERMGYELEDLINSFSLLPAQLLGLNEKGSLSKGKDADIMIIDNDYNVVATYVEGDKVYNRGETEVIFNPSLVVN